MPSSIVAQTFVMGNEWYRQNPQREFIKFLVAEEGIYRVTNADLIAAGYDLSNINPDVFQLYFRGEEVPMYVSQINERLEYLDFYGQRNDGKEEAIMYRDPLSGRAANNLQPNAEISIFSDTAVYFLTWDQQVGHRYTSFLDTNYNSYAPESTFTYESRLNFYPNDPLSIFIPGGGGRYDPFYTLNSDYVIGEGYVGPAFSYGDTNAQSIYIPTPSAANHANTPIKVKARVFGHSNTQHILRVEIDGHVSQPVLDTAIISNQIYIKTFTRDYNTDLTANTALKFIARNPIQADNNHICWASISYQRLFNLEGESQLKMKGWNKNTPAFFQFEAADGVDSLFVYDSQNFSRAKGIIINQQARVIVPGYAGERDLLVVTDQGIKKPKIKGGNFNQLHLTTNKAEFIIIAHRDLAASAEAYAHYRDTATINPMNGVKVVYTDEIYEEYGYGSFTPWAIKRFVNDALMNWEVPPKYILLWGHGTYLPRETNLPVVPTFGFPANDYEFVSPYNPQSPITLPQCAIGRINARLNEDGFIYLDKVSHYEYQPQQPWQQDGLFLGGGGSANERSAILQGMEFFQKSFMDTLFRGQVSEFSHIRDSTALANGEHHKLIDEGIGLIYFFGHSIRDLFEIEIKEPSEYIHHRRYPLFFSGAGYYENNFAPTNPSLAERWLFENNGGAIAWIGHTNAGYLNPLRDYGRIVSTKLFREMLGKPIGKVLQSTFITYVDSLFGIQYRNHGRQMLLQGDPALVLFREINEEFVWPGDANADGIANLFDVLSIGIAFGENGPPRPDASIEWEAQGGLDWEKIFANNINYKHADCDGSGQVQAQDIQAILRNYGLNHQKQHELFDIDGAIPLIIEYPTVGAAGDTVHIQVFLGNETQPAEDIYGLAFRLSYNPEIVLEESSTVSFSPSWLIPGGDSSISLVYDHYEDGWLDLAVSRIDRRPKSGRGLIADISIVITDDLAKTNWFTSMEVNVIEALMVDTLGESIPLNSYITDGTTNLESGFHDFVDIYPNPAQNELNIVSKDILLESVSVYDLQGQLKLDYPAISTRSIKISLNEFSQGVYLVKFSVKDRMFFHKMVIRR